MLLTTLQLAVDRPHLGRIEVAASVGKPDIAAHVAQVVRELRKDAEVPGFRRGKAPLNQLSAISYQSPAREKRKGTGPSP